MCRQSDPESKGRIENVVGFVKKNFAKHRVFSTIDKWNEQCQAWLVRTGNGKVHNTTKKRPVEVFQLEKKHLRPISKPTFEPSITRTVRKDNTICYAGNRYSVPLGTYRHGESNRVCLIAEDGRLKIIDGEGEIIADHVIDYGRGQLIQAKNHRRDRTKGIDAYMDSLSEHFSDAIEAVTYLSEIRNRYPRYIRDHLQLVSQAIQGKDRHILDRALAMCLDQQLYTGRDFRDVLTYLNEAQNAGDITPTEKDSAQIISPYACYQPETRDITGYIEILKGGVSHDGHSAS